MTLLNFTQKDNDDFAAGVLAVEGDLTGEMLANPSSDFMKRKYRLSGGTNAIGVIKPC
jgi:hypothetical protein